MQAGELRLVTGHHHLADALVINAAFSTILVEQLASGDAETGFERAGRIIDAGVHDFGVARAGVRAKSVFSFEDDDFAASHGHFAGDGKADGTGADDGAINFVHVRRVDSVNDAGKSWRPKCAGA